ncbi:MAG: iron-sulfur cluster assembly accessory protein [Ferruginibacter sp.]
MNSQALNIIDNSATAETKAPLSGGGGGMVGAENSIFISDKAKAKVLQLMEEAGVAGDSNHFLRVGVVGGGCSGLSYKMDFDNEVKPMDQVFEDKGIKIVCDLKSFLYLVNTELEFSDGLNGKGFYFNNPNASRSCGCGESFAV